MRKDKLLSTILLFVLFIILLSGCAGKGEAQSLISSQSEPVEESEVSVPEEVLTPEEVLEKRLSYARVKLI